ncbi:hypothetical protein KKF55_05615 [Patescibacteria group bacterium]|nr:hypothetical protein [Patescibacteria group bacterium]
MRNWFPPAKKISDKGVKKDREEEQFVFLRQYDLLFWFLVVTSIVGAIASCVVLIAFASLWSDYTFVMCILTAIWALALLWVVFGTRIILPDRLLVRTFIFGSSYITNCPAVTRFTKAVELPGTQWVFRTPEDKNNPKALIVTIPDDLGGTAPQLIVVELVIRLAIWNAPWSVQNAFLEEFKLKNGETQDDAITRAFNAKVKNDVLDLVIALADAPLQKAKLETLLVDVKSANEELTDALRDQLYTIGIHLILSSVEDTRDIVEDGRATLIYKKSIVKQERNTRQKNAHDMMKARVTEAEKDEKAQLRELERDLMVEKSRESVLDQKLENEQRVASIKVAVLRERLETLRDKYGHTWVGQILSVLDNIETPGQAKEVIEAWAELFNAAGISTEGGSVFLLGGDGGGPGGRGVGPLATGLGMLLGGAENVVDRAASLLRDDRSTSPETGGETEKPRDARGEEPVAV